MRDLKGLAEKAPLIDRGDEGDKQIGSLRKSIKVTREIAGSLDEADK